jgi:hypothetical protein
VSKFGGVVVEEDVGALVVVVVELVTWTVQAAKPRLATIKATAVSQVSRQLDRPEPPA